MNKTIAELRAAREAASAEMARLVSECNAEGFQDSEAFDAKWDAAVDVYEKALKEESDGIASSNRRAERLAMGGRISSDAGRLDELLKGRIRPDFDPGTDPRGRGEGQAKSAALFSEGLRVWASLKMPGFDLTDAHKAVAKACRINLNSDEILLPAPNATHARMMDAMADSWAVSRSKLAALRAGREALAASWNTMAPDSAGVLSQPPQILTQIETNRTAWGGLLQVATTRNTTTGEDLLLPFVSDGVTRGRRIAEDGPLGTEVTPRVGAIRWGSYKYSSDIIPVTYEMMRDSFLDLEAFIAETGGERLGRIQNYEMTNGNGASMPRGIAFAASVTTTTASPTAITYNEIIDLEMSLDDAYATGDRVGFMMHKSALKLLRKLVDLEGRPLLQLGQENGARDTLNGKPIFINMDMPLPTANQIAVLYGDIRRYVVRRTGGTRIVRDPYTKRMSNDVDLFAIIEYADGNLINTGTPAVVALQMHA